jgi:hypothetical protein
MYGGGFLGELPEQGIAIGIAAFEKHGRLAPTAGADAGFGAAGDKAGEAANFGRGELEEGRHSAGGMQAGIGRVVNGIIYGDEEWVETRLGLLPRG